METSVGIHHPIYLNLEQIVDSGAFQSCINFRDIM